MGATVVVKRNRDDKSVQREAMAKARHARPDPECPGFHPRSHAQGRRRTEKSE